MEFRVLGPVEVDDVALGGPRQRAILAVLLLHRGESVSAERLVAAVWGEDAAPTDLKALHVAVSRLRRALGADVIETTAAGYRVRVGPGELDLERFEHAAAEGREALAGGRPEQAAARLRDGLAEWRGPPLADLAPLPFAAAEIARLEEQRLVALEARVEADLALGRHAELVGELRALVADHPWRERLHGQLMLALYRTGRQADALDAYAAARAALVEELGIEPGPELRDLQAAVLAHDPALALRGAARRPALPTPVTTMFGRDDDLELLCEQVRTARLVTLVGPGGVGKTTLALAAARRLEGELADGARFVALAPVSDPGELEPAIERALAVVADEDGGGLRRYLAARELLLVLDNFEQLVVAAPVVAELLSAAPRLSVLVTSREPTRLTAERLCPLAPLAGDAAVELFVERVRARDPSFALNGGAGHVREICERLDGLPLALELAAARIGLLSPAELAARLDRALPLLAGGARDAPARHQTLRATIDWSYRLLDADEREAFTRFAVFAAGATVAAAEQVTGASLDTLDSLVAKQLLRRRGDRLMMLALVREYALELLAAAPDADAVRARCAAWLIALAESEPSVADSPQARLRLDAEVPNVNEAIRTALATGENAIAADLVVAWGRYWYDCGRRSDGLPWAEAVLQREVDPDRRARVLLTRGPLLDVRDLDRFRADIEAALAHFRSTGDAAAIATCLSHLAFGLAWVEDYDGGRRLGDEAVAFAEQSGDDHVLAHALTTRALVQEDFDSIAAATRPALAVLRRIGQMDQIARLCSICGFVAIAEGREREALPVLEEGVRAARASGGDRLKFVLGNLGLAKLFLGDAEAAEAALVETIAATVWSVDEPLIDEPLLALAVVHGQLGDLESAAMLEGAANANPSANRHPQETMVWDRLSAMLAPAREGLDAAAWEDAARRGAAMTPRDALGLAQRVYAARDERLPGVPRPQ